jgi:hypothetical protein
MIGLRELALVALVVLVLYGRSGVLKSRQFQTIWPWLSPARRTVGRPAASRASTEFRAHPIPANARSKSPRVSSLFLFKGNRLYWFLTILAATGVAAWVITRVIIASGAGSGATH